MAEFGKFGSVNIRKVVFIVLSQRVSFFCVLMNKIRPVITQYRLNKKLL